MVHMQHSIVREYVHVYRTYVRTVVVPFIRWAAVQSTPWWLVVCVSEFNYCRTSGTSGMVFLVLD
jgi:hypothetical protein